MAGNNWMDKFMRVKEQGMTALDKGLSQLDQEFSTMKVKGFLNIEKAKIKSKINGINTEINKLMSNVGELAYSQWENESNETAALEERFTEIKQKKDEIMELNLRIEEIEKQEEQLSSNSNGTNVEQVVATAEEDAQELIENTEKKEEVNIVCPGCGMTYDSVVRFCQECGEKLQ